MVESLTYVSSLTVHQSLVEVRAIGVANVQNNHGKLKLGEFSME